jgi:hypothetical protein
MVSLSFVTHTSILKMFSRFVFVLLVCGAGAAGRSPEPPSTSPGSLTSGTPDIQTLTMDEKFDRIASVLERTTSELKLIKQQQKKTEETKFLAQYVAGAILVSALILGFYLNYVTTNYSLADLRAALTKLDNDRNRLDKCWFNDRFEELCTLAEEGQKKVRSVTRSFPVQNQFHQFSALACFVFVLQIFTKYGIRGFRITKNLEALKNVEEGSSSDEYETDSDSDCSSCLSVIEEEEEEMGTGDVSTTAEISSPSNDVVIDMPDME